MLNFTNLSPTNKNFITSLIQKSGDDKKKVIYALAKVFSDTLMLPSSEVASPKEFFTLTYGSAIRQNLNDLNEMVIIDIEVCYNLILKYWLYRHNAANPKKRIYLIDTVSPESVFLGYGFVFSGEELKFIQDNCATMVGYYNSFSALVVATTAEQLIS